MNAQRIAFGVILLIGAGGAAFIATHSVRPTAVVHEQRQLPQPAAKQIAAAGAVDQIEPSSATEGAIAEERRAVFV